MEIELKQRLRLTKVELKVKEEDALVIRRCRMTLESEMDGVMAAALGKDAIIARDSVMSGGMTKVELPIDGIECEANLVGDIRQVRLPVVRGVKAVVKGSDPIAEEDEKESGGEDDEPKEQGKTAPKSASITLTFEFTYTDDAWLFLGRTSGAWADVHLTKSQLDLPGVNGPARLQSVPDDNGPPDGLAF